MERISKVPLERLDPEIKAMMRASDEAIGGSEWIQYYAHTPDLFKQFVKFYYAHIMNDDAGIGVKLTELIRHKVNEYNQCQL